MVAGSKRRKIEDTVPLKPEHLAKKLEEINDRDACLIALLYLSGRRINEVLHLKKQDIKIDEERNRISFETFNQKDYRMNRTADYTIKRFVKQRNFEGRKSKPYEGFLYYRRIRPHFKTDSVSGQLLTVFILNRLGFLSDKDYLFKSFRAKKPISYNMAYKILRKYFPDHWLHALRHDRFTEVFSVYKKDFVKAHRFTFHKRVESSLSYVREIEQEEELI